MADIGDGAIRQLSSGAISFGGYGGFNIAQGYPSWRADGRQIAISGRPEPDDFQHVARTEIFVIDVADGACRRLTDSDGLKDRAAFSPDGRHIACIGWLNEGKVWHTPQLLLADADGNDLRPLTAALDRPVLQFAWEQGGTLLFTRIDRGTVRLARIDLAGNVHELAGNVGSSDSAYLGLCASVSAGPDGSYAYAARDEHGAGDIVVVRDGASRTVTALPLTGRDLGRVEERSFSSTHDGQKLQGFLLFPPGFDPAGSYPLILDIHGGPWESWGPQFDFENRLLTARGYLVLLLNPRGSTGYGQAFADELQGDFPGDGIAADLLGAVEQLAAEPFVDAGRLYVSGASAGGTLTAWLTAHSAMFRAAATCSMVSDMQSMALTTDMPRRVTEMWFDGAPWGHRDAYWQRSPLRLAPRVKTPTLVLCGERDWRTPISQSEQYYTALKLLDVEARFAPLCRRRARYRPAPQQPNRQDAGDPGLVRLSRWGAMSGIRPELTALAPQMTAWRRRLHAVPELGFAEFRTSDFIAETLAGFGITEIARGLGGTGIVATLRAGTSSRSIGLRADMDALPIHEAGDHAHRSTVAGQMHACGHDGHTTMLLGAAGYLARHRNFDGTVHLLFQPAEESLGLPAPDGGEPTPARGQ